MKFRIYRLEVTEQGRYSSAWENFIVSADRKNMRIAFSRDEDRFARTHDAQRLEALPVADAIKSAIRGLA